MCLPNKFQTSYSEIFVKSNFHVATSVTQKLPGGFNKLTELTVTFAILY